jgi:hypothetical protein
MSPYLQLNLPATAPARSADRDTPIARVIPLPWNMSPGDAVRLRQFLPDFRREGRGVGASFEDFSCFFENDFSGDPESPMY